MGGTEAEVAHHPRGLLKGRPQLLAALELRKLEMQLVLGDPALPSKNHATHTTTALHFPVYKALLHSYPLIVHLLTTHT